MGGIRHLAAAHRRLALAMIACVLVMRAIVPTGWMPTIGAAGDLTLTICSGMGTTEIVRAADGTFHEKAPASAQASDHPCAFAGGIVLLADPIVATMGAPAIPARAVRVSFPTVAIGHGLAAPPPPSTGPPALI